MKNLFKLLFVVIGFTLASLTTKKVYGHEFLTPTVPLSEGGCVGEGKCGITSEGTLLIGKWREGKSLPSTVHKDSDHQINNP